MYFYLAMVCDKLPSPDSVSSERIEKLMGSNLSSFQSQCSSIERIKEGWYSRLFYF